MITESSDLREVSDFHFCQLKTLKLAKGNEKVPEKSLNIVAAASKYGLLFVGIQNGFKVLKLQDVLDLDEGKENKGIEENYPSTFIPVEFPVALSLNASQTTLAVCSKNTSAVILNLYDVSVFVTLGSAWQSFCKIPLTSQGVELRDFSWNPVAENIFAYCLSDGSIHIQELSGISVKPSVSVPAGDALSVCWSPKGKQLVVGKNTGYFTQYKPTLQEVKSIAPPPLEENPVVVSSICWISNTTFAVLYVAGDSPYFFIVSTPKDAPVSYLNFYDVCLGNNTSPFQKYLMHLEPAWGILVCASIDSIEIAVLGDMPNWVQWDLKEDGKALLPGKDGATHAIGMTVMYSSQKRIILSESESYPPMPVIFFLTNNGLLLPFHMINSKPDAASLVSPPLTLQPKQPSETVERTSLKRSSESDTQLTLSPSATIVSNFAAPTQQALISQTVNQLGNFTVHTPISHPAMNSTFGITSTAPAFVAVEKSEPPPVYGSKTIEKDQSSNIISTPTAVDKNKQEFQSINKENEALTSRNNSYMAAVVTEIQNFTKELQDLKDLSNQTPSIDSETDMATLKKFSLDMHNFQNDINKTMQSLNTEIFLLKNILLENFVMVEEAYSRDRRRNDHSYITMLKERALDPVTAKRLQKINQHYQYLSVQLQEVSDKLDQDNINLLNRKDAFKGMSNISSTEAIYKTIVNNQKIIHNLRKEIDSLMKKAEEKKLRNISKGGKWTSYHKRNRNTEDLSKLADEFLQVQISNKEEKEPPVAKKLSPESQKFLISFLKESNVTTVRPTEVYSPSQSRLLSNAATFEENSYLESKEQKKSADVPQENIIQISIKDNNQKINSQTPTVTSEYSSLAVNNSKTECTPPPYKPVYEAITPPEINKQAESTTLAYSADIEKTELNFIQQLTSSQSSNSNASGEKSVSFSSSKNEQNMSKIGSKEESHVISPNSSTITFPSFSSTVTSKAMDNFSFSVFPKNTENNVPKSDTGKSAPQSSSFFSNFQLGNLSQKEKSESSSFPLNSNLINVQPTSAISSITISEVKSVASPKSLFFSSQDKNAASKSNNIFNAPVTQSTFFSLPTLKPVTTTTAPQITTEIKIPVLSDKTASNASEAKNSTVSSSVFKLPPDEELAEESDSQEEIPSPPVTSLLSSSVLSIGNLNDVSKATTASKTSESNSVTISSSAESGPSIILIKSDTGDIGNISLDQITVTPIKTNENSASSSNQSDVVPNFSNLSIFKQSTAVPSTEAVEKSVASTIVINPVTSTVTITTPFTVPVVTSTINAIPSSTLMSVATSSPTNFVNTSSNSQFGANSVSATPAVSTETSNITTPAFGIKSAPAFSNIGGGASTAETPSFFSNTSIPTKTPSFGQAPASSTGSFGQPVTSSSFPSTSGGFFSQTPTFGAAVTTNASETNNQASSFSFGKSTFGQNSGSFGLAKSLFGQTTSPTTQSNSASNFSFGQSSTNAFGQGSFFTGLGGKPSEENANKNVFAMTNTAKSNTGTSLFGSSGTFGAKTNSFTGSGGFSSGSGSVAQSGFGAFQQNTPQKPAFGAAPAFGGAPTFGSQPAFGAPPTFGSGNALTSPMFNQQMPNFSSMADSSSPTFGSLASQSGGGFGSSSPLGGGTGFGSGGFGSSFGNSSFGGFGSPTSTPSSNNSAFTQWRN